MTDQPRPAAVERPGQPLWGDPASELLRAERDRAERRLNAENSQLDGLRRLVGNRGGGLCYHIDSPASSVKFAVSFLGLFTVEGSFTGLSGSIQLHDKNGQQSSVTATVPVATVTSGVALRDRHLRSRDYLDVERFPAASFESTAVEWQRDGFLVHGRLTVRGEQRAVVVHMAYPELSEAGDAAAAPLDLHGHVSVNRRQFGVLGTGDSRRRFDPRDVTIGNMVDITVRVRARPIR